MSKKSNGRLLADILAELATLKERVNNCISQNSEDHKEIKDTLNEVKRVTGDEIKEIEVKIRKLEDKNLQLSTGWKIGIFLMGFVPTAITVYKFLHDAHLIPF